MHLVLDIFQGVGIATAVGIRPFLPALAVGALAAGDAQIDFKGTDYSFLQSAPFLLAVVVAAFALALAERRGVETMGRGPIGLVVALIGIAMGAVLFSGALAQDHHTTWPGLIAGALCAAVGTASTRPIMLRVRGRLDAEAASAVPLVMEGVAVAIAVLSVLAPGFGVVALALLVWLLIAGRRRGERKYAGLRILR